QRALDDLNKLRDLEKIEHKRRADQEDRARAQQADLRERGGDFQKARDEVMELGRTLKIMRTELEAMQKRVQDTERRFQEAMGRLEGVRGRTGGGGSPELPPGGGRPGGGGTGAGGAPGFPGGPGGGGGGPGGAPAPGVPGGPGGGRGIGWGAGGAPGMMGGSRVGSDQDRRLQDLENKVDRLLGEMENLRRDLRGRQHPG